jgi:hypothetical protein
VALAVAAERRAKAGKEAAVPSRSPQKAASSLFKAMRLRSGKADEAVRVEPAHKAEQAVKAALQALARTTAEAAATEATAGPVDLVHREQAA